MKNIFLQLIKELKKEEALVLGTLLKTRGSTPQIPGVSAIFNKKGLLAGTLGGGILEAETTRLAKTSAKSGENIFQEYSLNADINDATGAICGGTATFLLDAHPNSSLSVFQEIEKDLENRKSGVLITIIEKDNKQTISILRNWFTENIIVPTAFTQKYGIEKTEIGNFLKSGSSPDFKITAMEKGIGEHEISVFIEPIFPLDELVIVGAGHVGQALCHFGSLVDFDVTIIDNRAELATPERFPDANRIITAEIDKGFERINITEKTFIVIVTQGHQEDAVALKSCIHSKAAYIGMIGSKRKTTLMREKFIADGFATKADLDRIYAPIGIDIHSKTVNEIAVSIVAQLIDVRYSIQHKKQEPKIHCILLAAGESKRMKRQKMLLPFNGKTIIETVVEKAERSKANKIWVVLGSNKEEIEKKISSFDINIIENRNYKAGMLSSVQFGFAAISESDGAAIILLGDQPMIETEVINLLIQSYRKNSAGIIIPTYSGKRGHPILIDMKFRNEINNLNPEIGLRELMQNHAEEILEIEVKNDTILKDIDTPEDYEKITKLK